MPLGLFTFSLCYSEEKVEGNESSQYRTSENAVA
jgi:hypothetical protein